MHLQRVLEEWQDTVGQDPPHRSTNVSHIPSKHHQSPPPSVPTSAAEYGKTVHHHHHFWQAPLRVRSTKRRHQSPEWTVHIH